MADAATPKDGNGSDGKSAQDVFEDQFEDIDDGEENDSDGDDPKGDTGDDGTDDLLGDEGEDDTDGEGDADPAADKDDDEDAEAPKGKDRLITVRINGQDVQVTESEAAAGYSRTADYTRKTTEAAETRKAAEAARDEHLALVKEYRQFLDSVLKEPNWEELKKADMTEYLAKKEEWRELQGARSAAKAEEDRLAGEQRDKDVKAFSEHLENEQKLLVEKIPHWKDQKVARKEIAVIHRGLKETYGFSDQEISQLFDHRAVRLIRDAMLYQGSKKNAKGKIKPAPAGRTLRPGRTETASGKTGRENRAARENLRQTGSPRAAQAVFEGIKGLLD